MLQRMGMPTGIPYPLLPFASYNFDLRRFYTRKIDGRNILMDDLRKLKVDREMNAT